VCCTKVGTELDAANVRRGFRSVVTTARIAGSWTPRELRHSFVSLLSANGVPVESIARLVGHAGTALTEAVYRKELRPVLTDGAEVIGSIFTHNKSAG
jgi:integrase